MASMVIRHFRIKILSERPYILETYKNTKESEVVERRWQNMGIEIIDLKHINPTPIFVFKLRLIVLGFGVVGQSFAKLLLSRSADIYDMYGIKPRIVACVDSKGASISSTGLDLKRLLDV